MKLTVIGIKAEIERVKKEFKARSENRLTRQTAAFVADVAKATPVDTGRAQAGWTVEKTKEGYAVKNGLPYIEYLNQGSSKQAPAHFVEMSALKFGTPQGAIVESVK